MYKRSPAKPGIISGQQLLRRSNYSASLEFLLTISSLASCCCLKTDIVFYVLSGRIVHKYELAFSRVFATKGKIRVEANDLLNMARDRSATGRKALSAAVTDLFSDGHSELSDRERTLMFEILRQLIKQCEESVRKMLSEKLSEREDVPRDLAFELGKDTAEVAYPILANCGVLKDEDLIEVIRNRTVQHQLAIAIRRQVSEAVSDALVASGNEAVITKLLANPNARISGQTMEYLVDESERVDTFQEPILRREDLAPALAQRMFNWVSAALRQHILDTYEVDEIVIDDILEQSAFELFTASDLRKNARMSKQLAETLAEEGEATPEMMLLALECGEVSLFVSMLEHMTGLRETLITRFILEQGGEGLAVVCKALSVGKPQFVQIFALCRKARPVKKGSFSTELRGVLDLYNEFTVETAKKVLTRWSRDMGYQQAIREIELAR